MNRFSGIAIFSSAYAICVITIVCCLHIKYDARELRRDRLVSPAVLDLAAKHPKPIHYVVMNPLKMDAPGELQRPARQPNILVAVLPASDEEQVSERPAISTPVALQQPILSRPELSLGEAWSHLTNSLGASPTLSAAPFSLASRSTPVVGDRPEFRSIPKRLSRLTPYPNRAAAKIVPTPAPHVVVAGDRRGRERIARMVDYLQQIQVDSDVIANVQAELQGLASHGALDAALCESALYRILDQMGRLPTAEPVDEDQRLIEAVKREVERQIHQWLDQMNGMEPIESEPFPAEAIDIQVLNIAWQAVWNQRWY